MTAKHAFMDCLAGQTDKEMVSSKKINLKITLFLLKMIFLEPKYLENL